MSIQPSTQANTCNKRAEKHRRGNKDDSDRVALKNPAEQVVVVIFR